MTPLERWMREALLLLPGWMELQYGQVIYPLHVRICPEYDRDLVLMEFVKKSADEEWRFGPLCRISDKPTFIPYPFLFSILDGAGSTWWMLKNPEKQKQ